MPTELLDLRLAFRALSDEDSDEGADDAGGGDITEDDDDLGDETETDAAEGPDNDEEALEE